MIGMRSSLAWLARRTRSPEPARSPLIQA